MIYKKPVDGKYWVAGRGVMGGLFKGMKTLNPNKGTASTINEKNEDEAEYNNKFDNTAPTGYRFTSKKLTAEARARLKGYWLQCANVNDKKLELKSDNKTWDEWLAKYQGAVQNCLYYLANNKFITQKNIDEMSNIISYDDFKINEKISHHLFHSTPMSNIKSIQKEGLMTGKKAKFAGVSSPTKIYLAANEDVAKYYGKDNDAVLRVKKDKEFSDLEIDLLGGGEGAYTTSENIPPEDLEIKVGKKWVPLKDY